jgi:hypothetical protein
VSLRAAATALLLALGGCTVGLTVTNSPDTLPCAPGKGPGHGC